VLIRPSAKQVADCIVGHHTQAHVDLVEVLGVAGRAKYVIEQLDEWTKHQSRETDAQMFGGGKAEIRYQPKGVIGNIVRRCIPG
jgi:coniferyl-aldehyde dehydrogenase